MKSKPYNSSKRSSLAINMIKIVRITVATTIGLMKRNYWCLTILSAQRKVSRRSLKKLNRDTLLLPKGRIKTKLSSSI